MTITSIGEENEFAGLGSQVTGPVSWPGSDAYAAELNGFDLSVTHHPALTVGATNAADVQAAVRFARSRGMGVAVQATGHGATAAADGALLINTSRANEVHIDASKRRASLQAGVTWGQVVEAAAGYGLVPLCGAAPAVGAVSYTLGGGLGPLGRRYGYAADHVSRIELITADGELRRVSADEHPDLFWGLRGGGGNFGVVTGLEIELMPVSELYAGGLYFAGQRASDVLAALHECTTAAPDSLSLSVAFLRFPDLRVLPAALRGQFCAHVRVTDTASPAECERIIRPLRLIGSPLLDTLRTMPPTEIGSIHGDPTKPMPTHARSLVLRTFDERTLAAVLGHVDPSAPFMIELRHLGGTLGHQPELSNAVGHRGGTLNVFTSAYPLPSGFDTADAAQRALLSDLGEWSDGGATFNFLSGPHVTSADVQAAFDENDFARLRTLKRRWDAENTFRFNANIPPA